MGGSMQPQGHVQILINLIDFGMNLQEAGDAPRFFHGDSSEPTGTTMTAGGYLSLEEGVPDVVRRGLVKRGHSLRQTIGVYGADDRRLRRLPGDRPRSGHRRLLGRQRIAQGRLCHGVLMHPLSPPST
jgi:hypothetical protein